MLAPEEIINVARLEHDNEAEISADSVAFTADILDQLRDTSKISEYNHGSPPLSLVAFNCMFQDTGYPLEVYLPSEASGPSSSSADVSQLRERWIGWGVEIPGRQEWTKTQTAVSDASKVNGSRAEAPTVTQAKYPLPERRKDYTGALIKVYDDTSYKPAGLYTVIGLLSSAALPNAHDTGSDDDLVIVPTIHALLPPTPYLPSPKAATSSDADDTTRQRTIDYISACFSGGDRTIAEIILLLLISSPVARIPAQAPIGTLSLNLIQTSSQPNLNLIPTLQSLMPMVVEVPMSILYLHSTPFTPHSADSTSLDSGLLQVGHGTVMVIAENEMGEGGQLKEKAVKNLQALSETLRDQVVKYDYPYMDDLKIECSIRGLVLSEGKSLLPTDICVPLLPVSNEATAPADPPSEDDLNDYRSYLLRYGALEQATKVVIPDEISQRIQDDFVESRQSSSTSSAPGSRLEADKAEQRLKRRMRLARLLAQSRSDAELSIPVWEQAVKLDQEVERRLQAREDKLQMPTIDL